MKNKVSIAVLTMMFAIMPVVALANVDNGDDGIGNLITQVETWVSALLPIMLSLGVLAFFYGLALFLFKLGGKGGTEKGKEIMIYGILAIFVMASIGGIVGLLQNITSTRLDSKETPIKTPCVGKCPGGNDTGGGSGPSGLPQDNG